MCFCVYFNELFVLKINENTIKYKAYKLIILEMYFKIMCSANYKL